MRKIFYSLALMLLFSHDLYINMQSYFLEPNHRATLSLHNGSFEKSENIISRDRIVDASVVSHGQRTSIKEDQWKDINKNITQLSFNSGAAGTYVVGVSTKANNIALKADEFNEYLEHDGVLDMLEQRKTEGNLDEDVVENYQKHVKAIYQVGSIKTEDWKTELGYPIEFVPLENPYNKHSGETLDLKLLVDQKPVANQIVYAYHVGEQHTHEHDNEAHSHTEGQELKTDKNGLITMNLPEDGIYYLRTIHMVKVANNANFSHESKWATLSFEVTHKHGESTHTHDHEQEHDHEDEFPIWAFLVGSALLIGVLFFYFSKRN